MSPLWLYDYEEFDIFLNLKLRDQETKKKGAIFTGASKFILLPVSWLIDTVWFIIEATYYLPIHPFSLCHSYDEGNKFLVRGHFRLNLFTDKVCSLFILFLLFMNSVNFLSSRSGA